MRKKEYYGTLSSIYKTDIYFFVKPEHLGTNLCFKSILSIASVLLYKYLNFAVNTPTDTGHTANIIYNIN